MVYIALDLLLLFLQYILQVSTVRKREKYEKYAITHSSLLFSEMMLNGWTPFECCCMLLRYADLDGVLSTLWTYSFRFQLETQEKMFLLRKYS